MSNRTWVSALKLWIVLARCHRARSLLVEQSAARAGLSLSDFQMIEMLLHKGSLTITEVQGKVLLASGSMTAAVDRAERKGLLVRTSDATDRRARRLELTEKGRQITQSLYKTHAEELETILPVLNDGETHAFYGPLRKLELFANEVVQQHREGVGP